MIKIDLKILSNPHVLFALIWTVALVFYFFGWSGLFPELSGWLIAFLVCAILLHLSFGLFIQKTCIASFVTLSQATISLKNILLLLNLLVWLLNFAYSGVPLIKILRGEDFDYREFGMPTVIVFAMSFNSFLTVYYYHIFLSTKSKRYLLYAASCLLYFVLIYSRGLILMTGMSMFFLWLSSRSGYIKMKFVLIVTTLFLIVLYVFGAAGNVRMNQLIAIQTGSEVAPYSSDPILTVGAATESFRNNIVPNEFFWGYIYIASPLSNLQYNIDNTRNIDYSVPNVLTFGVNEFTYDFISKRFNTALDAETKKPLLIVEELTVSTIFAESYRYLGWAGMACMLLFMLLLPTVYCFLVGVGNELLPLGMAVLTSIYFFSFFDNMLIYSGLGLQLVYPFLLKYLNRFSTRKIALTNAV